MQLAQKGEYAQAGVDYGVMRNWKSLAVATAERTITFPMRHNVRVNRNGTQEYIGSAPFIMGKPVIEGLGNKNVIAEWMYQYSGLGSSFYRECAICNAMMSVNDFIAGGGVPTTFNDEVAAGQDSWFGDMIRAKDFFDGVYEACNMAGMALVGGESSVANRRRSNTW